MAKLNALALFGVAKEVRIAASDDRSLAVAGAPELVAALMRELARDGDPDALVGAYALDRAAALVLVLVGPPSESDEALLKKARRARVPVVCLAAGPVEGPIPFVLAADVVHAELGRGFPLEELAGVLARRLGEAATPLAARLPVLRDAVCAHLVESFARRNAITAAAVFVPGADLPILTLNQARLVLRIAAAHGEEISPERLPEIVAVVGGGLGFRALARELLDLVPVGGWLVKGAVAYAGTRALGEAAVKRFGIAAAR